MSVECNITATVQPSQRKSFGDFNGAPAGHISHTLPVSLTNILCDAKFSNLEPSCGAPTGFDTKFTLKAICPVDGKVTNEGKKILFGYGVEDVLQNDPYCPPGSFTDPQLFKMMQHIVLLALNYTETPLPNPYNFIWKVNGQAV